MSGQELHNVRDSGSNARGKSADIQEAVPSTSRFDRSVRYRQPVDPDGRGGILRQGTKVALGPGEALVYVFHMVCGLGDFGVLDAVARFRARFPDLYRHNDPVAKRTPGRSFSRDMGTLVRKALGRKQRYEVVNGFMDSRHRSSMWSAGGAFSYTLCAYSPAIAIEGAGMYKDLSGTAKYVVPARYLLGEKPLTAMADPAGRCGSGVRGQPCVTCPSSSPASEALGLIAT